MKTSGVILSVLLATLEAKKCRPKHPSASYVFSSSVATPEYAVPSASYSAPSYAVPSVSYSAPSYAVPSASHSAPSYAVPSVSYSAPSYAVPSASHSVPSYAIPSASHSAPSYAVPSVSYSAPSYVVSSASSSSVSVPSYTVSSSKAVSSSSSSTSNYIVPSSSIVYSSASSSSSAAYPTTPVGSNTFNGITYSPYKVGDCYQYKDVEKHLIALSKYTSSIKLYGADCNQVENVLKAIVSNNLNLKVLLGLWVRDGEARLQKEIDSVTTALKNPAYRSIVIGVTVGNEEVFHGSSCATACKHINNVRNQLKNNGISGLPISTVDVYKVWDNELIGCSDVVYANIYAFFTPKHGDGKISTGVQGMFKELDLIKSKYSINKQIVISETGWATEGSASVTFAEASIANQCEFLSQFQCQAKKHQYSYYIMEALDAAWKSGESCEKHFGIFDQNFNLKCSNLKQAYC